MARKRPVGRAYSRPVAARRPPPHLRRLSRYNGRWISVIGMAIRMFKSHLLPPQREEPDPACAHAYLRPRPKLKSGTITERLVTVSHLPYLSITKTGRFMSSTWYVCSSCFADPDIRAWIRSENGPRGCDACGGYDSPTTQLGEICEFIEGHIEKFWGRAAEQLPYESAEGGYQGSTWDTAEIVFEDICVELPRDKTGRLYNAIVHALDDEVWCDYDWLSLDEDVALKTSWERFCEIVKHQRRFFFHSLGGNDEDRDSYSCGSLLRAIAQMSDQLGLIRKLPPGTLLWRARPDIKRGKSVTWRDFGPPPKEFANQSNRMNPPGIPMMYVASSATGATKETRATSSRVGCWRTLREARILDLRNLPAIPGPFSDATRQETLGLRFLNSFAKEVTSPVARDDRVHVEYLPSQVVSEFLRDFEFQDGRLDGVAYKSVVDPRTWNVALFVETSALRDEEEPRPASAWSEPPTPWLRFVRAIRT